jgi:UDP-glucose 4-epimerase
MKILVTGGAGFIGSHLVRALVRADDSEVTVLDDLSRGCEKNLVDCIHGASFIRGSICDPDVVRKAMRGADLVFHLAAQSNVMGAAVDLDESFASNVIGTFNVFSCAEKSGVRRVVFTSSREVYGETAAIPVSEEAPTQPKNAYGASKLAGEVYASVFRSRGLDISVLRLSNVYGLGDRDRVIPLFLQAAATDRPLILYGGQQVIDFIWIDEVVRILISCANLTLTGDAINVGSGCGVTVRELANRILTLTQSRSTLEIMPARSIEVTRFVANVYRARALLNLTIPADPLFGLHQMISKTGDMKDHCRARGI